MNAGKAITSLPAPFLSTTGERKLRALQGKTGELEGKWKGERYRGRLASVTAGPAPVVEVAFRDRENSGEARVVGSHHLRLGRLLADCDEALDVLHTAEGLLPQLQFACHLFDPGST